VKLMPYEIQSQMEISQENWGISTVKTRSMWNQGIFGEGSVIAVVDTGCDIHHESLSDNIIGGANFTSEYSSQFHNFQDNNGHGTHVAGIIASNNLKYNIGMAPKAKLLILKALNQEGHGSIDSVVRALYYAALWRGGKGEKVDVVCLSLGTKDDNPLLKEAVKYLVRIGILVVVASGNDGDGTKKEEYRYPGYYNEVIQVGSIEKNLTSSYFSNNNKEIDISAPGSGIFSTYLNNTYKVLSGTSMATPFVAGSLALIVEMSKKRFQRKLSEAELYAQLIKSTNVLDSWNLYSGNGILDLSKSFK
jgi:major intracellular serine protease